MSCVLLPANPLIFFKRLKSLTANPQSNDNDNLLQRRINTFYGQEPLSITSNEAEVFGSKSYSSVTQNAKDSGSEIVRLTQIVNDLQVQVDSLSQTIATDVSTAVVKDVDTKIEAVESRLNASMNAAQEDYNDKIAGIETKLNDIMFKMDTNNSTLLAAIRGDKQPPSGDGNSARGEDE